MRSRRRAAVALLLIGSMIGVVAGVVASMSGLTTKAAAASPSATSGSQSPAFNGDAPDPDIVLYNGTYYAFTTGTALGNNLQALIDTTGSPTGGWRSYTGESYGSSALPAPPAWESGNTQTSPGVFEYGGHWVMFYDAAVKPYQEAQGHSCISVATVPTLTSSHPVFTDTSTGPLFCRAGGVLDPSPFIDPRTGAAYLIFKSNDGSSTEPSQVWSVPLSSKGTSFAGTPKPIFTVDQAQLPWETTTDDPQIVYAGSSYRLLFSVGNWQSSSYAEVLTTCSGPLGPCGQPTKGPPIVSTRGVALPGGGQPR